MKSKLPAPTAKDINEAHRLARASAETAVGHAIRCGQMLMKVKESVPHGSFQDWVARKCDFSERTARVYMQAANQNGSALPFSSLRAFIEVEKKPSKKQPDTTAPSVKGAVMNPPESAAQGSEARNRSTPSGEESGAREAARSPVREVAPKVAEVTPAPDFDFTDYEPEDDDAYKTNVENVMRADDKLAAMREELKQTHRELQGMKSSRDHYQSQAGEAVRLVKARDREIEKLKKELAKAKEECEALRERVAIMENAA